MYPTVRAARDRFVLERRGPRPQLDPWRHQDVIVEDELSHLGTIARSATVFLTGKECPWRCVMCDLWRYTTPHDTPRGAIPAQLAAARAALSSRRESIGQIKLYNASNFFDDHAVPESDHAAIVSELHGLDRVIVESHPALVGTRVDRFLHALNTVPAAPRLEVAMGLETANPEALERLNKGIALEDFAAAATELRRRSVDLRVFVLISPPFIPIPEQDRWLCESLDFAFACGASIVSLIPTRDGNGAMEALAASGLYARPDLSDIERSVDLAHQTRRTGRVSVDLWDLERFARCPHCVDSRRRRLRAINLEQCVRPSVVCDRCGHGKAT